MVVYAIRRGIPADLPWLELASAQAAWESLSERERQTAAPQAVAQIAIGGLRSLLALPGTIALVAHLEGRPVGFLLANVSPDGTTGEANGLLVDLWVAPAHRRRGLAKQLQAVAEEIFRQMGIRKAKLWTGLHNQAAVQLAQKSGYQPEGLIGGKAI